MLRELLRRRADEIADRWLEDTLAAYPARTAAAWRRERDPFANPVGHGLREGTRALVDWLLNGADAESVRTALDRILQVRAVQEQTPGEAVSFVFRLKAVIRAELGEALEDPSLRRELVELESRVDSAGLAAFDLYVAHRERLFELRVAELKRSIPWMAGRVEAAAAEGERP
ncbi:MAG: RsbRD N-terminal domain-containing protein [Gemmatimonadota bacterium]|jgi:hypothetical protein